jgi:predicted RNA binding protein YcfA (HicA-like mRNA interferase family)
MLSRLSIQRAGWKIARVRGSHIILEKEGSVATLSMPVHKGKNVKKGTLRGLIKDANLSIEEFIRFT